MSRSVLCPLPLTPNDLFLISFASKSFFGYYSSH
jgi:hypothetical protein